MAATLAAFGRAQAIIEFDLGGNILTANPNFLTTMGYELSEIVGRHHRMFIEPADRDNPEYKQFWERLNRGEHQVAQFKRIGKNGREVWIEASYNPVLAADGRPFKIVKTATDVTRHKLEYADLLGQVSAINKSQAVIEFDLDGTIRTANALFLEALGYSLAEVVGHHHRMFVDPAYCTTSEYDDFWSNLRSGRCRSGQFKRFGKSGKPVWIEASYNPIFDLNGKPFKIVKYATDVTKQVQVLNQLNHSFGEIDGAVERSTEQASLAVASVSETSNGVQTMAASAEELAASVCEIAVAMVRSKTATDTAHMETNAADEATQRLTVASRSMEGIVELIRNIAGQINLLALNATIEAARAGEAGKGFAVVASEVKNLASQSRNATDQISQEIAALKTVSSDVVIALGVIKTSIDTVRDHVTATAGAVEEQSVVTQNLSANMQTASANVLAINDNMSEISGAVNQAAQAVNAAKDAAQLLAG